MLFRGNVLVGYDFDTEDSDFDEMVKNGTLVFSEERERYILSNTENDKEINILFDTDNKDKNKKNWLTMKITKEMFPDYSIVRHTSYGREVDYAQVGFINISERDIAALLNGEILDVVGDIPILIRFQHNDNLTFGESVLKYMKPRKPFSELTDSEKERAIKFLEDNPNFIFDVWRGQYEKYK